MRIGIRLFAIVGLALGLLIQRAAADVHTFINDVAGWAQSNGGPIRVIDFETLPNGSASYGGAAITPSFNYTAQGATFTSPVPFLFLSGTVQTAFDLTADSGSPGTRNWITADLVVPTRAVGVSFPGRTTLYAFSSSGALLGSVSYGNSGGPWFVGITSDTPIARAVVDEGVWSEDISAFIFNPTPEPATAGLLAIGAAFLSRRRGRT